LLPDDYGPIWFTWYGFGRHHGQFAVAHVETSLATEVLEEKARNAEAGWEADALQWLPIKGLDIKRLSRVALHDGWLPLTTLAARGLLDIVDWLGSEPVRH
jgi:hypothetical protein